MIGLRVGVKAGPTIGVAGGVGADPLNPIANILGLVFGQSNAFGQQYAPNITLSQRVNVGSSFSRMRLRQKSSQPAAGDPIVWTTDSDGQLAAYTSSQANNSGHTTALLGPVQSLGRHLDFYAQDRYEMAVFGVSGAGADACWKPSSTYPTSPGGGPNLLTQAISFGVATATAYNARVGFIVWIGGESDCLTSGPANAYQANLTDIFNAFRAQWPGVPIVHYRKKTTVGAFASVVRAAEESVTAAMSNVYLVDVDDLVFPDNVHFDADSYVSLGDRVGYKLVQALGLTNPKAWTVDPVMLTATPANATEANALCAAAGWPSGPSCLYLCQEASGNLTDTISGITLTASGTGVTYLQPNPAIDRKAVVFADNATGVFSSTNAALPDPATTSQLRMFVCYLSNGNNTAKNLYLWGTSGFGAIARAVPANRWQLSDGGNTVASTTNPQNTVRPFVHARNRTSGSVIAYTDNDKIIGTIGTMTGKSNTIGSNPNANHAVFFVMEFFGSAAERSSTQCKTLLQTMGYGDVDRGATAISWS